MLVTIQDINRLGDEQFEKLVKTLLMTVIGRGVTPFAKGKDGAREAKFLGKAPYPTSSENWDGGWIFQVKYSDIGAGLEKARNQVKYLIESELAKLEDYGYLSSNQCDNYIYITNVPFTGESKTGLHDYIEAKKAKYMIKHFDYWDGEKVTALVNSLAHIRESFFPLSGFNLFDTTEWERLKSVFVEPKQYQELKKLLLKDRLLNIVGQPHVGKTSLAMHLAQDIAKEIGLTNVFIVPLIDNVSSIPKIDQSVIVFDDLYGDLTYEHLGRRTKLINELQKSNYIIITSRDYIFRDALDNGEVSMAEISSPAIVQEGSYSNEQLAQILINHALLSLKEHQISPNAFEFVLRYKNSIITKVRFPHNLQFFVETLPHDLNSRRELHVLVQQSLRIENVVRDWVILQDEEMTNLLMLLSIGRITELSELEAITKIKWNYERQRILTCLNKAKRIIKTNGIVKFLHPSFKDAVLRTFIDREGEKVMSLILDLITSQYFKSSHKLSRPVISEVLGQLDATELLELLDNDAIRKQERSVLWYLLFQKDMKMCYIHLKSIRNSHNHRFAHQQEASFISSRHYMTIKEVMDLLSFLFSRRSMSPKFVDNLILAFSYKVIERLEPIVKTLDENTERDLRLKVLLLGAIGSRYPERVFEKLVEYGDDPRLANRRDLYTALQSVSLTYREKVIEAFKVMLQSETNQGNRKRIMRTIADKASKRQWPNTQRLN